MDPRNLIDSFWAELRTSGRETEHEEMDASDGSLLLLCPADVCVMRPVHSQRHGIRFEILQLPGAMKVSAQNLFI